MEDNNSIIQYEEFSLENLCSQLSDMFEQTVTENKEICDLFSDDTKNIDKIKKGIIRLFGIRITIADIIKGKTVLDLYNNIKAIIDSPKFLMSEKDVRRMQLEQIVDDKDLKFLTGSLEKADKELANRLDEINKIVAPVNIIGYHTDYEGLNKFLDTIDPKVSKSDLIKVVEKIDENYKGAFQNLGTAVTATNKWIDAICSAILWMVQIENDLYDISDAASQESLKISNLLSQDGKNIEGITAIAAKEKSRRKQIQEKIEEFKADIEGKIDFLNDVNHKLKTQYITLEKEQHEFMLNSQEKLSSTLDALLKRSEELSNVMRQEQQSALRKLEEKFEEKSESLQQVP